MTTMQNHHLFISTLSSNYKMNNKHFILYMKVNKTEQSTKGCMIHDKILFLNVYYLFSLYSKLDFGMNYIIFFQNK